jgi:Protein of unknown function (DUF2934)
MNGDLESETRKRAFEIWEREGGSGDPAAHWFQAERELARDAENRHQGRADGLPECWAAAIEAAVEKLTRRARARRRPAVHDGAL